MVVNAIDEIINFGKANQLDLILGGRAHFMHMYVVCDESYLCLLIGPHISTVEPRL